MLEMYLLKKKSQAQTKTLIKINLEKDITFLQNNLRQNNIVLPKRKIYSIKNNLIQQEYPPNINYTNNILKLKIEQHKVQNIIFK